MEKIVISVYHKFLKRDILKWEFWYDREKATVGWYSRFWKKTRQSVADDMKTPIYWIRCKVELIEGKDNRTILSLPSGFKIDMPENMNDVDYEIILLHLQALKLSCNN